MKPRRNNEGLIRQRRPTGSSKPSAVKVEKILLQPWFLPKKVALAIHAMVTVDFRNKMHYMFEDYGCLVCGSDSSYYSNGMCIKCFKRILKRLAASLRRHGRQGREPRFDLILFRQEKLAKKLLNRFIDKGQKSARVPHHGVGQNNPVYEAFAAKAEMAHRSR
jgi:hypothetical protein